MTSHLDSLSASVNHFAKWVKETEARLKEETGFGTDLKEKKRQLEVYQVGNALSIHPSIY